MHICSFLVVCLFFTATKNSSAFYVKNPCVNTQYLGFIFHFQITKQNLNHYCCFADR